MCIKFPANQICLPRLFDTRFFLEIKKISSGTYASAGSAVVLLPHHGEWLGALGALGTGVQLHEARLLGADLRVQRPEDLHPQRRLSLVQLLDRLEESLQPVFFLLASPEMAEKIDFTIFLCKYYFPQEP